MTQPVMPAVASDANKVIAKLQMRHAGELGAADRELAITQVAFEELQERYHAVVAERDQLLEKMAELTAEPSTSDAAENEDAVPAVAPAVPASPFLSKALAGNGSRPEG
jgi:hypothetical protein